ncbi:GNAT family N-acetyltransferase [Candidatus Roizmanbacteria bacterium]|nr:GNAT family N-acetyltransferase [Candidatus Roizmanbacteria bacterium]
MEYYLSNVNTTDIESIQSLLLTTWKDTYITRTEEQIEEIVALFNSSSSLQTELAKHYWKAYRLKSNKNIVGIITVVLHHNVIEIARLYIHPDHQRKHLGSKLIKKALAAYPLAEKVIVNVDVNNTSGRDFYFRQQFTEIKTEKVIKSGFAFELIVLEKVLKH